MTDEKTVQQHMQAVEAVAKLLTDTTAQIYRLRRTLVNTRRTLEALTDLQHPKLLMRPPGHLEVGNDHAQPAAVILKQVADINAILGDRA